jgi:4-hydroxybenzoate polyprenyltransferase
MTAHAVPRALHRRRFARVLLAARVIHPFPTTLNVAAAIVLAAIANDGLPAPTVLSRLAAAMFCAQAAIGATNDYFDRDLDALTKPWKPLVRGAIEPGAVLALAAVFAVVAGLLSVTFGPLSVAAGAIGLAAGLAYNVRLKRTVLSAVPFMVALATLPFWVWLSLDRFDSELWWLLPFAPLAGIAVHLANTLPDLDSDASAGVRGLAHTIGRRASIALAWGSFATAIAFALLLGLRLDYRWVPVLLGAGAAAVLLSSAIVIYARRPGNGALQIGFGLIGMATAALAAGWLAAVT